MGETIRFTDRQRQILIKNHGSLSAAIQHHMAIESMIVKAQTLANQEAEETGEDSQLLFHRHMVRMRKEVGLWSE